MYFVHQQLALAESLAGDQAEIEGEVFRALKRNLNKSLGKKIMKALRVTLAKKGRVLHEDYFTGMPDLLVNFYEFPKREVAVIRKTS